MNCVGEGSHEAESEQLQATLQAKSLKCDE